MHDLSTKSDIKPLHTVSNLLSVFRLTIGSYAFYPIPFPTVTGKQDAWKLICEHMADAVFSFSVVATLRPEYSRHVLWVSETKLC